MDGQYSPDPEIELHGNEKHQSICSYCAFKEFCPYSILQDLCKTTRPTSSHKLNIELRSGCLRNAR